MPIFGQYKYASGEHTSDSHWQWGQIYLPQYEQVRKGLYNIKRMQKDLHSNNINMHKFNNCRALVHCKSPFLEAACFRTVSAAFLGCVLDIIVEYQYDWLFLEDILLHADSMHWKQLVWQAHDLLLEKNLCCISAWQKCAWPFGLLA